MENNEEFEFVENTDKRWNSTYVHQRRADPSSRLKKVIPKEKLVDKRGRFFSTDTSQQKLIKEIDEQDQREASLKKTNKLKSKETTTKPKFLSKNE